MAQSTVKQGHLELDGSVVKMFDVSGFVEGNSWCMTGILGSVFVQVDPAPAKEDIEETINTDISDGNGEKISYIRVNPNTGVRLFLDGTLTKKHIRDAHVTAETIGFSDVLFKTSEGEKKFEVIVTENFEYSYATFDVNGNVV